MLAYEGGETEATFRKLAQKGHVRRPEFQEEGQPERGDAWENIEDVVTRGGSEKSQIVCKIYGFPMNLT